METGIRKATIEDVPAVSMIHALSWKTAYIGLVPQQFLNDLKKDHWIETFTGSLQKELLTVQLLSCNGLPIGCISYGASRDINLPDWGEIVSFYLLPEYWGKGYAAMLLDTAMDELAQSFQNVYLWVLRDNHRARRFYEKNKFQYSGEEFLFELNGEMLTDVRYVITF